MNNSRILFVDDDVTLLEGIRRALRKQFSVEIAVGPEEGLRLLRQLGPFAVIVADMQMPGMSGLELLKRARAEAPDTVRIMLTGNADQETAANAVNDGHVFRFLTKPSPPAVLAPALEAALAQFRLVRTERDLLENTLASAIKVLTEILTVTDPVVMERCHRVKEYVGVLIPSTRLVTGWELEVAAMLCQIGRVTVPASVLEKAVHGHPLSGPERDMLERIPELGARLVDHIPRLENVAQIMRYQCKNFDGTGQPQDGVCGNQIPIGARFLRVFNDLADFEGKSISRTKALLRMSERNGVYDTAVLAAVSKAFAIQLEFPKPGLAAENLLVEELRVGYTLAQELRTRDGVLIALDGTRISPMVLEKLQNFRALKAIDRTILVQTNHLNPMVGDGQHGVSS